MNPEQLQKLGKGVWGVVSEAICAVHEGKKKLRTYADMTHPLVLWLIGDAKRAISLTEQALKEVDAATDAQKVYQLRGRLKKHLMRFDMRRNDCVFSWLDAYLISIGGNPTDFGSALIGDVNFDVKVKDNRIVTQYTHTPVFCEHANEMPSECPCKLDCYCKFNACKSPTRVAVHRVILS